MLLKKLRGEERRDHLLQLLKNKGVPITGSELAKYANVSRQVIVNDMTLLKVRKEPIVATSQGYVYISPAVTYERTIACFHNAGDTEEELNTLVDAGATVKDVTVEHQVYGELTASIMVSNRHDVGLFLQKVKETGSGYLLELTGGIHMHTISAPSEEILDRAVEELRKKGFLADEQ